ncbi:FAD-dependent oxidoreductase [Comamonadaceae bacterium M7527]|nr:FAD-dependent oxidoreductase [Comamonadaceae bacterium M7527]
MTALPTNASPSTTQRRPNIAVVGSGIAGLSAAYHLRDVAHITVFEAGDYFGGHTNTVDVTLPTANGQQDTVGVDTGFLVLNERTYPALLKLFAELNMPLAKSDMSFSVQVPGQGGLGQNALEWSGTSLTSLFCQPINLLRPSFWRMVLDILRFNKLAKRMASTPLDTSVSLGAFLTTHGFSKPFIDWYLLPMLGSIWSCPTQQMLAFPVATLVQFCDNHGLIQVANRPAWYTVAGGARQYVQAMVAKLDDCKLNTPVTKVHRLDGGAGVDISYTNPNATSEITEHFDYVVMACHSDQSLKLLSAPHAQEQDILSAIGFQPNVAVLHTDESQLPVARSAWSAWNYERAPTTQDEDEHVCLHYLINQLQPLPFKKAVVVSLNPIKPIAPEHVLGTYHYAHPVFDAQAVAAQQQLAHIQGQHCTYYCGAWTGYGFHEDGLKSGIKVAQLLREQLAGSKAHA